MQVKENLAIAAASLPDTLFIHLHFDDVRWCDLVPGAATATETEPQPTWVSCTTDKMQTHFFFVSFVRETGFTHPFSLFFSASYSFCAYFQVLHMEAYITHKRAWKILWDEKPWRSSTGASGSPSCWCVFVRSVHKSCVMLIFQSPLARHQSTGKAIIILGSSSKNM